MVAQRPEAGEARSRLRRYQPAARQAGARSRTSGANRVILDMAPTSHDSEPPTIPGRFTGVPEVRLYDTRHSHLIALLVKGAPLKVASVRAGHSSVQITADIYMDSLPNMDADAAAAMEEVF